MRSEQPFAVTISTPSWSPGVAVATCTATVASWPVASDTGHAGCVATEKIEAGSALTFVTWTALPEPEWMIRTGVVPVGATVTCEGLKVISEVPPMHTPAAHVPPATHTLTLSHEVPSDALASAGHCVPVPEQVSGESHWPPAARQVVPAARYPSAGQLADAPEQVSARSQAPVAGRHVVVDERNASAGQLTLVPEQVSAWSQAPAAARHVVVDVRNASTGQVEDPPEQVSAWSQLPAEARHVVVGGRKAFAGHVVDVPEHVSALSHGPAAARQA